jgi:hypothetical protein
LIPHFFRLWVSGPCWTNPESTRSVSDERSSALGSLRREALRGSGERNYEVMVISTPPNRRLKPPLFPLLGAKIRLNRGGIVVCIRTPPIPLVLVAPSHPTIKRLCAQNHHFLELPGPAQAESRLHSSCPGPPPTLRSEGIAWKSGQTNARRAFLGTGFRILHEF